MIQFNNSFHNSTIKVEEEGNIYPYSIKSSTYNKVVNHLCGIGGCKCQKITSAFLVNDNDSPIFRIALSPAVVNGENSIEVDIC